MTKATMPEPVAYFYQRDFDKYKDRYTGGIPVITTDQAEAYADARVRVALETAAAVAEERSAVLPHYSDFIRGYANGRKDAASAIRALLQKENT